MAHSPACLVCLQIVTNAIVTYETQKTRLESAGSAGQEALALFLNLPKSTLIHKLIEQRSEMSTRSETGVKAAIEAAEYRARSTSSVFINPLRVILFSVSTKLKVR